MAFKVEKAKREKIYVKVAVMSPSGSGKSWSELRLNAEENKDRKDDEHGISS